MSSNYTEIPSYGDLHWQAPVASAVFLPALNNLIGAARITTDTDTIYVWNGTAWIAVATPGAAIAIDGLIGDVTATGPGVVVAHITAVTNSTLTSLPNLSLPSSQLTGTGNLTDVGTDGIVVTGGTGAVIGSGTSLSQHVADPTHNGYLSASDWSTFNNKEDKSNSNYITNPDAELNTVGWNLYNNSGRTVPASLTNQDLTYTSTLSGGGGNGVEIEYIYNASFPAATPNINVISPTHVQVQWNNGPTVSNNPTATQLAAAWNGSAGAVAIATIIITGTASKLQYITGAEFLGEGGDTSPTNGTGGSPSGVTFTRNTSTPLVGVASFDLGKASGSAEGQGVSTDFAINSVDKNKLLQIEFVYQGSSNMVLGSSSDVQVFMYDIDNSVLIPVTPTITLSGPVNTPEEYAGVFMTSSGSNYRLILHIATANTLAWDLLLDSVTVTDELNPVAATEVPSLVLQDQPISNAVTDHMVVMWTDGSTHWVPATISGAALPTFGDDQTQLGFATNIDASTADIFVAGFMDGFSFGPFAGYNQYIDNIAGGISPLPSPFTDLYVIVGVAISSTALNINFVRHVDEISNGSGVPIKGGLLTSSAVNDGTGDVVLSPGANNTFLVANSAVAKGLNYRNLVSADIPNNAANTTGSAATLTTARTIAGTSFNGSANIALANKFVVEGTADAGLSGAQFLGALGTGIVKNTATTGVLSIAVAGDFPTLNQSTTGSAATLTTSRTIAGTGFNGSANIALANKFIVQGTTDAGLSGAQFLGALATGLIKNTTTTGVLSAAAAGDVTGQLLTGYTLTIGGGTVAATDSILTGIEKLVGQPQVKTGTNGKIGTATLAAGTVTVANTSVTANSRIFLTVQTLGTIAVPVAVVVTAKVVNTSFTITSASITDTSTVAWMIVESIP